MTVPPPDDRRRSMTTSIIERVQRRRMRRVISLRPLAAVLFIMIGLVVFLAELGRHYWLDKSIEGTPIFVGATVAFVGFYMLDPKDTLGGGTFLVNSFVTIISSVRGRRASDKQTIIAETIEEPNDSSTGNPGH